MTTTQYYCAKNPLSYFNKVLCVQTSVFLATTSLLLRPLQHTHTTLKSTDHDDHDGSKENPRNPRTRNTEALQQEGQRRERESSHNRTLMTLNRTDAIALDASTPSHSARLSLLHNKNLCLYLCRRSMASKTQCV